MKCNGCGKFFDTKEYIEKHKIDTEDRASLLKMEFDAVAAKYIVLIANHLLIRSRLWN